MSSYLHGKDHWEGMHEQGCRWWESEDQGRTMAAIKWMKDSGYTPVNVAGHLAVKLAVDGIVFGGVCKELMQLMSGLLRKINFFYQNKLSFKSLAQAVKDFAMDLRDLSQNVVDAVDEALTDLRQAIVSIAKQLEQCAQDLIQFVRKYLEIELGAGTPLRAVREQLRGGGIATFDIVITGCRYIFEGIATAFALIWKAIFSYVSVAISLIRTYRKAILGAYAIQSLFVWDSLVHLFDSEMDG